MSEAFCKLRAAIEARTVRVAVLGLDERGLRRALAVAKSGFSAIGFDCDAKRIEALQAGSIDDSLAPAATLSELTGRGFRATDQPAALVDTDVLLINVPTPLTAARSPDLAPITRAAQAVAGQLRPGQLILLERTAYPGMTREVIQPLLEKRGLKAGAEYFLGASPGGSAEPAPARPRVVGGADARSLELGLAFYKAFSIEVLPASSVEAVEANAVVQSVFDLVQAGVLHELRHLFAEMQLDPREVFDLAGCASSESLSRQPLETRWTIVDAVAPNFLSWIAPRFGLNLRSIEWAGEIQRSLPGYWIERIADALNDRSKPLKGSKILLWGTADVCEGADSLEARLLRELRSKGAEVECLDANGMAARDQQRINTVDVVVVLLGERAEADRKRIVESAPLVIDLPI